MNPTPDNGNEDPPLDSAWSSISDGEPSPELDRRILAEARAVASHRRRRAAVGRWAGSVALAASLVLGISLTWQMMGQDPRVTGTTGTDQEPVQVMFKEAPVETGSRATKQAPSPAPASESSDVAADRGAKELERVTVGGSRIKTMQPERPASTASDAGPLDLDEGLAPPPEEWLEDIRALRAAGKHRQADRSLLLFQRIYPNYPLPAAAILDAPEGRDR